MKSIVAIIITFIIFTAPGTVSSHPGNTAADGCHYCRTNCDKWGVPWNERHCHNSRSVPISKAKPVPKPEVKQEVKINTKPEQERTSLPVNSSTVNSVNKTNTDLPIIKEVEDSEFVESQHLISDKESEKDNTSRGILKIIFGWFTK